MAIHQVIPAMSWKNSAASRVLAASFWMPLAWSMFVRIRLDPFPRAGI